MTGAALADRATGAGARGVNYATKDLAFLTEDPLYLAHHSRYSLCYLNI